MSVFLFVLFSKRSFKGSAQLILYVRQACLSVFLFVLFSKRSFIGSAKLLLYDYRAYFFILSNAEVSFVDFQRGAPRISAANPICSPSLLERFFICTIFKAELYRISAANPLCSPSLLERFFICTIFKAELYRISEATPV